MKNIKTSYGIASIRVFTSKSVILNFFCYNRVAFSRHSGKTPFDFFIFFGRLPQIFDFSYI